MKIVVSRFLKSVFFKTEATKAKIGQESGHISKQSTKWMVDPLMDEWHVI